MTTAGKKVLVTGASGFIGSELCRQLTNAGYSLRKLTRSCSPPGDSETTGNEYGTDGFSGDILDRELLERALTDVKIVFHLAGVAHVDGPRQELLQSVNVEGTANLAAAAVAAGVEKIIYFSSSLAVAAEQGSSEQTAYGRSKFQAEQRLFAIARNSGLRVTILRPVNVYGTGMQGNLAALIRLIARGLLPPLPKLDTRLSLVGLHDLCRAALLAADSEQSNGRIYLVTDSQVYKLNDVVASIYQAVGKSCPAWHSPRALFYLAAVAASLANRIGVTSTGFGVRSYRNLVADNVFDSQLLCNELSFVPQQTFYTALPDLVGVK